MTLMNVAAYWREKYVRERRRAAHFKASRDHWRTIARGHELEQRREYQARWRRARTLRLACESVSDEGEQKRCA